MHTQVSLPPCLKKLKMSHLYFHSSHHNICPLLSHGFLTAIRAIFQAQDHVSQIGVNWGGSFLTSHISSCCDLTENQTLEFAEFSRENNLVTF